jgi:hypothetical protein
MEDPDHIIDTGISEVLQAAQANADRAHSLGTPRDTEKIANMQAQIMEQRRERPQVADLVALKPADEQAPTMPNLISSTVALSQRLELAYEKLADATTRLTGGVRDGAPQPDTGHDEGGPHMDVLHGIADRSHALMDAIEAQVTHLRATLGLDG